MPHSPGGQFWLWGGLGKSSLDSSNLVCFIRHKKKNPSLGFWRIKCNTPTVSLLTILQIPHRYLYLCDGILLMSPFPFLHSPKPNSSAHLFDSLSKIFLRFFSSHCSSSGPTSSLSLLSSVLYVVTIDIFLKKLWRQHFLVAVGLRSRYLSPFAVSEFSLHLYLYRTLYIDICLPIF